MGRVRHSGENGECGSGLAGWFGEAEGFLAGEWTAQLLVRGKRLDLGEALIGGEVFGWGFRAVRLSGVGRRFVFGAVAAVIFGPSNWGTAQQAPATRAADP
jgi:hypothetical protein